MMRHGDARPDRAWPCWRTSLHERRMRVRGGGGEMVRPSSTALSAWARVDRKHPIGEISAR